MGELNISGALSGFEVGELDCELIDELVGESFHGRDVDDANVGWVFDSVDCPDHRQSSNIRLTGASGRANQHVLYPVVGLLEHDALDLVQVLALEAGSELARYVLRNLDELGLDSSDSGDWL